MSFPTFLGRFGLLALPLALAAVPLSSPAQAQQAGSQATQVATSGDWNVYTANTGKSKVCYALSQPKERLPAGLKRDPGYIFVSFRPAEKVSGELAMVVGFPTKEDAAGEATIDTTSFSLLSKGPNVWLQNASEEPTMVAAMQKGMSLLVKVQSKRGNSTTDRYSLSGFSKAYERAQKECQ